MVDACVHHWLLGPGEATDGTCKKCGEVRHFDGGETDEPVPALLGWVIPSQDHFRSTATSLGDGAYHWGFNTPTEET